MNINRYLTREIITISGDEPHAHPDHLALEEPLEIAAALVEPGTGQVGQRRIHGSGHAGLVYGCGNRIVAACCRWTKGDLMARLPEMRS